MALRHLFRARPLTLILACLGLWGLLVAGGVCTAAESRAVIFVPGFKGSVLAEPSTQKILWLDARWAFFHIERWALDVDDRNLSQLAGDHAAQPLDVIRRIPLFVGLYSYDVYGKWLAYLQARLGPSVRVVPFAYDWRQDNARTAAELGALIEALRGEGFSQIDLLAHSMGGLVSSYYLRYGGQPADSAQENWEGARKLRRVVFAGVPFRGAERIAREIQTGTKTVMRGTLLSAPVMQSFQSAQQLVPDSPSLFIHRLHAPWVAAAPPEHTARVLNVIGIGHATLVAGGLSGTNSHEDGDDLVDLASAQLPAAYDRALKTQVYPSAARHGFYYKDGPTKKMIVDFLQSPDF